MTNSSAGRAATPAAPRRVPSPDVPLTAAQTRWVDSTLASLSLRERIGQMVNVWVLGDFTNEGDPSYQQVLGWVEQDHVGGMTMSVGSPVEVAVKVNALQRRARVPLLVASDLEPGLGRLEGGVFIPSLLYGGSATVFPNAMAVGATDSDSLAYAAAHAIGSEARAVGIQVVFGPVADVNNNPANPVINTRSFGESPAAVARLSSAWVRGLQDAGAMATAKHFPGHGDTDTDSHLALPIVRSDRARLDSVELVPFRAAIAAGVSAFMTAHIALPAIEGNNTPATLAPGVVTGLLRDTLHFHGLTYTDALTMEAVGEGYTVERSAVLAVQAGADVLVKPSDVKRAIDAVEAAVNSGTISAARIDSSARRMLVAKARVGLDRQRVVDLDALRREVGSPEHWALADTIAARAVTLLRDSASLVPVAGSAKRIAVVSYAPETEFRAGRLFAATVRASVPNARVVRISPRSGRPELDSLAASLAGADAILVTTHVRTIEGAGRFAVAPAVAQWIDSLATREKVIVVAHGNPYVIRQFPRVGSYLVTYGVGDALERAAARAALGLAPITAHAPISLPGFFARGDGLTRSAPNATDSTR
ncbi:MAG TPA: glycoside hydrolase family 3 N-terminal domain-containing protein [Gemmatimonadaceae bacterium]